MIHASRFLASQHIDEDLWRDVRSRGVSATEVAKASTEAGWRDVLEIRNGTQVIEDNAYMQFGRDQEPKIAMWVKDEFGIMPNDWVITHQSRPEFMATPDGLSLNHKAIAEIKTSGKDFESARIPIQYRRQMQWQMFVTGADYCVFVWMLRIERDGIFVPGWFQPKYQIVEPDQDQIDKLKSTAEKLLEVIA